MWKVEATACTVEACSGGLWPGSAWTASRVPACQLVLGALPPCCMLKHAQPAQYKQLTCIANSKAGKFAGGTVLIPAQHDERLQKPTALQGRVEVS